MSTDVLRNIESLCRACMRRKRPTEQPSEMKTQSIYDFPQEPQTNERIIEILLKAIPDISVHPLDKLPKELCFNCVKRLVEVRSFQEMCIKSQNSMIAMLEQKSTPEESRVEKDNLNNEILIKNEPSNNEESVTQNAGNNLNKSMPQIPKPIEEINRNRTQLNVVDNENYEVVTFIIKEEPEATPVPEDVNQTNVPNNTTFEEDSLMKEDPSQESYHQQMQYHSETDFHRFQSVNISSDSGTSGELFTPNILHQPTILKRKKPKTKRDNRECPICCTIVKGTSELTRHMKLHDPNVRPFQCSVCENRFSTEAKLDDHYCKYHCEARLSLPHPCDECSLSFHNENALATHKKHHNDERNSDLALKVSSLKHTCFHCGITYKRNRDLSSHLTWVKRSLPQGAVPEIIKPYICRYCDEAFETPDKLRKHKVTHKEYKPYVCLECGLGFNSHEQLKEHKQIHKETTIFQCPHCPKRLRSKESFDDHCVYHTKVKRFKCDECGALFGQNYMLKRHMDTHYGIKKFHCEHCGKRFATGPLWKRHVRLHTGERPYKCKYCGKGWIQSNELVKHLRTHVGDKVYCCNLCPKKYRYATELRQHYPNHEKDNEETKEKNLQALKAEEEKLRNQLMGQGITLSSNIPILPIPYPSLRQYK